MNKDKEISVLNSDRSFISYFIRRCVELCCAHFERGGGDNNNSILLPAGGVLAVGMPWPADRWQRFFVYVFYIRTLYEAMLWLFCLLKQKLFFFVDFFLNCAPYSVDCLQCRRSRRHREGRFANADAATVFLHFTEMSFWNPAPIPPPAESSKRYKRENNSVLVIILTLVPRSEPISLMMCPVVVSCRGLFLIVAGVAIFKWVAVVCFLFDCLVFYWFFLCM